MTPDKNMQELFISGQQQQQDQEGGRQRERDKERACVYVRVFVHDGVSGVREPERESEKRRRRRRCCC